MKVGSLVECVSEFSSIIKELYSAHKFPELKSIYTVRDMDISSEGVAIRLEEIINPVDYEIIPAIEPYFTIQAFKEIQPPMEISIEEIINKQQKI